MTNKIMKIQIFENGKRVEKAKYHGKSVDECIEKLKKENEHRGA